jgi:hypothetical protein
MIDRVMRAWVDAWVENDPEALVEIVHPDLELYLPRSAIEGIVYRGVEGAKRRVVALPPGRRAADLCAPLPGPWRGDRGVRGGHREGPNKDGPPGHQGGGTRRAYWLRLRQNFWPMCAPTGGSVGGVLGGRCLVQKAK